ncbi:hypothetical protein [Streptomyces sp. XY332]|uniref:hypothetical protein n=1 Tax=Streptomyces sp. XY332 TaxID=1415561 RepID=UPI00131B9E80|nr:hypothetical protein [Streptomyces sp. XY332]
MTENPRNSEGGKWDIRHHISWWVGILGALAGIAGVILAIILSPDDRTLAQWVSEADGICEQETPIVRPAMRRMVETDSAAHEWITGPKEYLTVAKATEFALRTAKDSESAGMAVVKMNGRLREIERPQGNQAEIEKALDAGATVSRSLEEYSENAQRGIPRTPEFWGSSERAPLLMRKILASLAEWEHRLKALGTSSYCWADVHVRESPSGSPSSSS